MSNINCHTFDLKNVVIDDTEVLQHLKIPPCPFNKINIDIYSVDEVFPKQLIRNSDEVNIHVSSLFKVRFLDDIVVSLYVGPKILENNEVRIKNSVEYTIKRFRCELTKPSKNNILKQIMQYSYLLQAPTASETSKTIYQLLLYNLAKNTIKLSKQSTKLLTKLDVQILYSPRIPLQVVHDWKEITKYKYDTNVLRGNNSHKTFSLNHEKISKLLYFSAIGLCKIKRLSKHAIKSNSELAYNKKQVLIPTYSDECFRSWSETMTDKFINFQNEQIILDNFDPLIFNQINIPIKP